LPGERSLKAIARVDPAIHHTKKLDARVNPRAR
jgi:hypothetical protein